MTTWTVRTTTITADELGEISGSAADSATAYAAAMAETRRQIDTYDNCDSKLLPWYCLTIDEDPVTFIATGRRILDRRPDHDGARDELRRLARP